MQAGSSKPGVVWWAETNVLTLVISFVSGKSRRFFLIFEISRAKTTDKEFLNCGLKW